MIDIGAQLGVQSYCFRGFPDNEKVAGLVKEIGLSKVELRGVHGDFDTPQTFGATIRTYRDAGVDIVAIGVQGLAGDEAKERNYFEFLKACGVGTMSVDFAINTIPESFRVAEKLA